MPEVSVRLLTPRVGHRIDAEGKVVGMFSQATGQVVKMPADEAQRYLDRGLAEEVEQAQGAKK